MKKKLLLTLVLLSLPLSILNASPSKSKSNPTFATIGEQSYKVASKIAVLRTTPMSSAPRIRTLGRNERVSIIAHLEGGWSETKEGGYIPTFLIIPVVSKETAKPLVNTSVSDIPNKNPENNYFVNKALEKRNEPNQELEKKQSEKIEEISPTAAASHEKIIISTKELVLLNAKSTIHLQKEIDTLLRNTSELQAEIRIFREELLEREKKQESEILLLKERR